MQPFIQQSSLFPSNDSHNVGGTPTGAKPPAAGPPMAAAVTGALTVAGVGGPAESLGGVPQTAGKVAGAPQRGARTTPGHLVVLRALADQHTLALWAGRYLAEEVCGVQAVTTFEAKSRDLAAFVT